MVEARYEAVAGPVLDALRGIVNDNPRAIIRTFVLLKADPARTRVLLSQAFTAEHLLAAAAEWQQGAMNLPPVRIRQFTEDRRPDWVTPPVPYPATVIRCLNTAWLKGATSPARVPGLDFGDGLRLLLTKGHLVQALVRRAMRQAAVNMAPLILGLAQAHQLHRVFDVGAGFRREAMAAPSVLGLLLHKAGSYREDYMAQNPYLIGRLLSLADRMHRNYCERQRDGQLPKGPLLGNALMATTLENPAAGLARLAERLAIYYSVAETALRAELAEVEAGIDKSLVPDSCTDVDKAQMLLGYLARPDLLHIPTEVTDVGPPAKETES